MSESDIPKGYKATGWGLLPENWNLTRLSEVIDFTKKPLSLQITSNQLLPFIPMEVIPDNNYPITQWQEKRFSDISSGTFVFKGDLLVAKITPCFENGKQVILDNLPTDYTYATTEVWPMHPKDDRISNDFLANYLQESSVRTELTAKMEGSTNRQRLPREALQNLIIPLPPLSEQHAIAATLRTVQEAKERTDAVIAATKALKASMMKHLFRYGPVPPNDAEKVALKETEIGQIPKEWDVKKIGDVSTFQPGYAFKSEDYVDSGVRLFKISNVSFGMTNWNDVSYLPLFYLDDFKQYRLMIGDLVIAMTRPIVQGGIKISRISNNDCPSLLNQRVGRFIPKSQINLDFLFHSLFNDSFINAIGDGAGGSQQPNISGKQIERILIPVPSIEIQNRISMILSTIDQKLAAEQSRKEALDTLFASLLHDLMIAKIRVKNIV